jgi:hypothetical protein
VSASIHESHHTSRATFSRLKRKGNYLDGSVALFCVTRITPYLKTGHLASRKRKFISWGLSIVTIPQDAA